MSAAGEWPNIAKCRGDRFSHIDHSSNGLTGHVGKPHWDVKILCRRFSDLAGSPVKQCTLLGYYVTVYCPLETEVFGIWRYREFMMAAVNTVILIFYAIVAISCPHSHEYRSFVRTSSACEGAVMKNLIIRRPFHVTSNKACLNVRHPYVRPSVDLSTKRFPTYGT